MRVLTPIIWLASASAALAHHSQTPIREAVIDGHSHDVGGATWWLLGTALAMFIALYAVQRAVFPKKK